MPSLFRLSIWTIVVFLSLHVQEISGSKKYKLKPAPKDYIQTNSVLLSGEKYTGCMCPGDLNTTGTFWMFCGHELQPRSSGGICHAHGLYRCINGMSEAILRSDCQLHEQGPMTCIDRDKCTTPTHDCKDFNQKTCNLFDALEPRDEKQGNKLPSH